MIPTEQFASRIVDWQRVHGRHDLPWQRTRDAYRIWLSEIMLQQTQVATVIPYYERFLERFPDVAALGAAPLDEVMALWSGLGYYSRARNLHRCAQEVVARFDAVFPTDPAQLVELPGIGRSTAAAIAAFAGGARAAILDGNVKRVLARAFGIEGFPGAKPVETMMWALAESLLPPPGDASIGAYTQGLMDLGATLCGRGAPQCNRCPLADGCVAFGTGRERELPMSRPKKTIPTRQIMMLVLRDGAAVLLQRRPPTGIWGGLWSLPEAAQEADLVTCARSFGGHGELSPLRPFTHTFTHFHLEIAPRLADCDGGSVRRVEDSTHAWVPLAKLDEFGVPAPVRRLLLALEGSLV